MGVSSVILLGILLCFIGVESSCYSDYQQCYNTYQQVSRPQSYLGVEVWTSFCNAVNTFDTCLKNDVTSCGSNTEPEAYTKYVNIAADSKKSCSVVDTCARNKCTVPNEKCTNLENLKTLPPADGVNCCKTGASIKQCLEDCGDNNLVSSHPVLQRSYVLCHGYNDFCPNMFDCFAPVLSGGFNGPANMCKNVGTFLTCIEGKCANKPQIGQQSLAKIREVFNSICGVVGKYPSIASCQTFTSCIEKTPSLPGTVFGRIQGFTAARDSDRWCQIAKSYVACGSSAAEGNSCNQVSSFTTDVLTVKTATDQACTGVREPCLQVESCLVKLGNAVLLKDTCPKIPEFVKCIDDELKKCGDGSRVKADYSIDDVKDIFVETCDNAKNDDLFNCDLMETCFDLQLPTTPGDMIVEFSDQTFWCRKLNIMLKCTADLSTACQQPKSVHDKFMTLYNKVNKLCPLPGERPNGAASMRVTGVVVITVLMMIFY